MAFGVVSASIIDTNNKTDSASWSFSPASTIPASRFAWIIVATDNGGFVSDTSSASSAHDTMTDSVGNTWTRAGFRINGSPGSNAGAIVSMWYSLTAFAIASTDTITINFGGNLTARGAVGGVATYAGGSTVQIVSGTFNHNEALSITTAGSCPANSMVIRGIAIEDNENAIDTKTTGWGLKHTDSGAFTTGGGAAANISCGGEYIIPTGAGTQTSNPTTTATGDMASIIVAFEEVSTGPTSYPYRNTNHYLPLLVC